MMNGQERLPRTVELAANIVAGHVRRTETSPDAFADLLLTAYRAIADIERASRDPAFLEQLIASSSPASSSSATEAPASQPASPADTDSRSYDGSIPSPEEDRAAGYVRKGRRTVHHDRLLCLDDGQEVTFLGRHLRKLGTTESDYRRRWGLPDDYPMTTQAYVDQKKDAARRTGFGTSLRPDREARTAASGKTGPAPVPARTVSGRRSGTLAPAY